MPAVRSGRMVNLLVGGNKSYCRTWNRGDRPAPTIATAPDQEGGAGWIATVAGDNGMKSAESGEKPPYRVVPMAEIAAIHWNGFTVVSTFSGCGGSCLGYRMAGFRVVWASDCDPAARETYLANWPDATIDGRDIRRVNPEEILGATGMVAGEVDLFDGSPPCVSFSTAGKREADWGRVKDHAGLKQRTDDLFFEYIRLLKGLQPRTFVAENVSGLVKGVAKGFFLEILAALKAAGYRVKAQVLDAQWLGVPQMRQRVIFVGVREDLGLEPAFPKPLPYRYSVREALPWIIEQGDNGGFGRGGMRAADGPSGGIGASPNSGNGNFSPAVIRAKVIHDTSGLFSQGDITDRPCPAITGGIKSLDSKHFQVETETDISRYAIGRERDKLKPGEQSDRFFSLAKPDPDNPCPTVTIAGSTASAASICHPAEKRKFSIAELRRICGFPDDFILTGTYADQWARLGNAVPPVMMSHIAAAVRDGVLIRAAGRAGI